MKPMIERFLAKVKKTPTCWIWTGAFRSVGGYGFFHLGREGCISAHRAAYIIFKGSIPKGKSILHSCDNKKCVNPEHLTAGTQSQNLKDCLERGRFVAPKGERNGQARLTLAQVESMRSEYTGTRGDLKKLSKKFGVASSTVHSIVNRNRWRGE